MGSQWGWVLHTLAWAAFAIRPLSDVEMDEALVMASAEETSPPATSSARPRGALLLGLELALQGLFRVREHVVWVAPELSSHLRSAWPEHFGVGLSPEHYLSRACFALMAPRFQSHSLAHDARQAQPMPALSKYAIEYWMEHQLRESSAADSGGAAESFSAILETSPGFESNAWIRHLSSSHWSADVTVEARTKLQPDAIQQAFGIGPFEACHISYRMSLLPLNAEDNFDWILLGIAGRYLSEDAYIKMVLVVLNAAKQSITVQRTVASAESGARARLLTHQVVTEFVGKNFLDILLTAIAIGNATAIAEFLDKAPQHSLGYNGEGRPAGGLGTALQVACEYGDVEVVERILAGHQRMDPLALETSYPWNALHVACQQGRASLIEAIGRRRKNQTLDTPTSARFSPLLVTSARGL
jgi:hypothetical protein